MPWKKNASIPNETILRYIAEYLVEEERDAHKQNTTSASKKNQSECVVDKFYIVEDR